MENMTQLLPSFKIFTPTPILGYGYSAKEFWDTVENHDVRAIIVDAGSTDPGPYMLGTGKTLCSRQSYIRDLTPMMKACAMYGIKVIVSSAGGAGTNEQVDFLVSIVREIVKSEKLEFKVATIKFEDNRVRIKSKLEDGKTKPCGPGPPLKEEDVTNATSIVAQMGAEPFMEVLQDDTVDIVIAGRSYDPAPFAAFCMLHGVEESTAWHVGKIIECGGLCAVPKGRSILATMHRDSFDLTPTNPVERCNPVSVAAHTLYEKTRPDRLPGPGGVLHLDEATYDVLSDGRSVRVKGSTFVPTPVYELKLEGAEKIGYRTIYIGGVRDPILIEGIDDFLKIVKDTTTEAFSDLGQPGGPQLIFHVYGKNAVMGPLEPVLVTTSHELGIMGEVVADSQDIADAVAGFSRTVLLHGSYDGQLATGGNIASPLTPLETSLGPVFKFSLYHLMEVEDPTALFATETFQVGEEAGGEVNLITQRNQTRKNHVRGPTALSVLTDGRGNGHQATSGTEESQCSPVAVTNGSTATKERVKVKDIAAVVRSKNSGPFEITLDILFTDLRAFELAKSSDALRMEVIQQLYQLPAKDIITLMFFKPALGWKCTFKRPWPQGSVGERDTFGAQMHAPLLEIVVQQSNIMEREEGEAVEFDSFLSFLEPDQPSRVHVPGKL